MTRGLCIVTGASRGIGAATAIAAAKAGWDIAVNYVTDRDAATQVVNEIRECGRKAIAIQADVAQEVNIMRLFKQAEDELGAITALVNNAGTTGKITRVEDMSSEAMKTVLELNVLATCLLYTSPSPRDGLLSRMPSSA